MDLIRKKRTRLYEDVVEQIRRLIAEGTLAPGDQLLPERQLAEKLGVSRTAVREALTSLASLGLLEITPGSGAYVKEANIHDLIDPFASVMLKEIDDIFDILEARQVLETGAAALAAKRAERTDLRELQEFLQNMESDVSEGRDTDQSDSQFHFCIVRASHNTVIINLMTVLMGLMREYYGPSRKRLVESQHNREMWAQQHAEIYGAIKTGDAKAAMDAAANHLDTTITEFRKLQSTTHNSTNFKEDV